jgi:hypothetical protein
MDPVKFVNQMYTAGAKNYFDALSFHPYHYYLKFSDGVTQANSPAQQVIQMRQAMISNGDSAKKIWNTEYGQPTSISDPATQSAFIKDMYTKWQEMPYTGPLMFYTTRDRNTSSTNVDDTFGLFNSDWTAKPAQQDLKAAIAAGIPKSPEFQRFSTITDPAHGSVLSPVFRATPTMWAQIRTVNTLFETPNGIFASPKPVADFAIARNATPNGSFANGWQDFNGANGFRVWWSQSTGVHSASYGFAQAWVPQLGLATSDEIYANGGSQVNFHHGYITWMPWTGFKVTLT